MLMKAFSTQGGFLHFRQSEMGIIAAISNLSAQQAILTV